ncbi:hypothetical protein RV07_GL002323 [Enterococcus malodoratus]|nr:hypothetical protein RV07_GL002323 [Enterococcus malodoratus]
MKRKEGIKMANERFKRVYSQGKLDAIMIFVDRETGVNYMFNKVGYAGGLTPLLDKEGKPVITPLDELDK